MEKSQLLSAVYSCLITLVLSSSANAVEYSPIIASVADEFPWEIFMPAIFLQNSSSPVCQDNDNDGYGDLEVPTCPNTGRDCNDNNSSIYPGAPEICGDGIDQDCNGEDLACMSYCADFPPPPGETHTYQYINTAITFSTITQSVSETVGGYTVYRIWVTDDPPELGLYIGCDDQLGEVDVATDWWDISDPSINGRSFWEPPIFYCQYGQPVGTICNWTGTDDGELSQQIMEVVAYETVSVPFGTYPNAMKARITEYPDFGANDFYYWIHPDVGILKFEDITDAITGVLTAYNSSLAANTFNNVTSIRTVSVRSNIGAVHQILRSKRKPN